MNSFRLLTIATFALATVPRLAHRGMFVDGVTYASIARNLAEGRGSFWTPSYTATIYPVFHEHPPLGFWLQSMWFRLLGDHLFVERAYSVTAALATAAVIAAIWRRLEEKGAVPLFEGDTPRQGVRPLFLGWLPILLWIAVPVVSWAIVGNLLETTVALFTTTASLAALRGVTATAPVPAVGWGVLSGLSVVAAALTKGPVGLFPLVAPLTFLLLPQSRRIVWTLAAQWTTVAACAAALLAFHLSRTSLTDYIHQQVLPSMSGAREVGAGSFTIVKELLQEVILPIVGLGILAIAAARRLVAPSWLARRQAASFALLGLAGTLPILVSAKQAGHYLVPAVPLYVLAAAIAFAPSVGVFVERWTPARARWVNLACLIMLLGTIGAAYAPGLGRDQARLANLDALDPSVPRDATVGICPTANDDWGLHAWFERRFRVSLDAAGGRDRDWFLRTARAGEACSPPARCLAATDQALDLVLMKCVRSE
jgi:4-amino-4-deoxy-L-arabinose transferase-like glycosyltransferase